MEFFGLGQGIGRGVRRRAGPGPLRLPAAVGRGDDEPDRQPRHGALPDPGQRQRAAPDAGGAVRHDLRGHAAHLVRRRDRHGGRQGPRLPPALRLGLREGPRRGRSCSTTTGSSRAARHSSAALRTGDFRTVHAQGKAYAYVRSGGGELWLVALNAGTDAVEVHGGPRGTRREREGHRRADRHQRDLGRDREDRARAGERTPLQAGRARSGRRRRSRPGRRESPAAERRGSSRSPRGGGYSAPFRASSVSGSKQYSFSNEKCSFAFDPTPGTCWPG